MTTSESIRFAHHNAELVGTLYTPDAPGRAPVVIVLHAAEGGQRTYPFYQHLATVLPAAGIAVLLYDRRGSGSSTGTFETADFSLLAGDAHAAIMALNAHSRIDPARICVYGISQGGWIAPLVAQQCPSVALLVIVSGCGVTPANQMIYSTRTALGDALYPDEIIDTAIRLRRQVDAYFRGVIPREVVQAQIDEVRHEPWFTLTYLDVELPDSVRGDKWYYEMDFDPLAVWRQVHQPVLFTYGENDKWVPIEESIQRYRNATAHIRDVTIQQIAGTDHLMRQLNAPADAGTNGCMSDSYLAILTAWLCDRFDINATG